MQTPIHTGLSHYAISRLRLKQNNDRFAVQVGAVMSHI